MAKQLNIDMSVRADVSQAKQAMANLQKSLNDVISTRTITIDDKSINNAKQAAIDLKHHIEAATNASTGKLDLSKFSASLNKSGQSLQGLYNQLSQIGPAGQSAFLALSQSIAKADASAITLGGKLNSLMVTLKNTAKWQLSSSLLHGFMGAIQGAYGYAQDLNESLNNIRIVTGQNIDQMAKFAKEANSAAQSLSTTTTEYTNASLIYYQQGLSDTDVKARTDATVKLANITRQSAEEVSSQMTAIWNNFDDGSKSLEYYEDVITALGASTASSSAEIAEGLQKFAAVSDTVGLSYEKATSALATVVAETRQSADVVGTAFKTIFARIEGLQLGETLEDGVDLNKYTKALNAVGVQVLDINGNIKSMDEILDETGEKWKNISKEQQIALAQTVAGTRQYTQFVALMDNYDKVQKNQGIAESSEGTVQKQADIYAESWEAARDRVTAAAQEIYNQLLNDEAFIDILNGVEKFLGFISNIIDGLGGLKGILLLIGSIFMQQYAKEVPVFMQKAIDDIRILTGAAEKQRQTMVSQADTIVQNMSAISNNKELEAQITGMQKVSAMYKELAEKRQTLSSAEIAAYEQRIKDVEMYGKLAEAIGKEINALKKKNSEEYSNASRDLYRSNTFRQEDFKNLEDNQQEAIIAASDNGNEYINNQGRLQEIQQQNEAYKIAREQYKQATQEYNKGELNQEDYNKIIEKVKGLGQVVLNTAHEEKVLIDRKKELEKGFSGSKMLQGFQDASKELGRMNGVINQTIEKTNIWNKNLNNPNLNSKGLKEIVKDITVYRDKLNEAGIKTKEVDEILEKFASDPSSINVQELQEIINVFKDLNSNNDDIQQATDKVAKFREALVTLGVSETTLDKLQQGLELTEEEMQQYNAALEQLKQQQEGSLTHTVKMSEVFTQLGSTIMQASMAINAFKNLGNIWSNEDLSVGEKILQTMTTFGTLIPIITTLMNKEKIVQMGVTAARVLDTIGIGGQTTATLAKVAADEMAAVSGWAALGPILAFVAIAAVVIAAIGGIIALLVSLANAETEEEKALRLANEELERSKKAADEAKQAYEDLKDKISNYDSAIEALEKCTKGTREWRDAFQEVMQQVSELIAAYPQLLQYENLYNSDGTLNQNILDQALKLSQQAAIAASNAVIRNTAAVSQANLSNNISKEIANITNNEILHTYQNKVKRDHTGITTTTERTRVSKSYLTEDENGIASRIDATELAEKIGKKIINEGNEKINFLKDTSVEGKENIEDYVRNYLNGKISDSDIENATKDISSALIEASNQLENLSEETKKVIIEMNNAKNVAFENYFSDTKFKDTNEELAYQKVYNEKIQDLDQKLKSGAAAAHSTGTGEGNMSNHNIYGNESYDNEELKKALDLYVKQHPELSYNKNNINSVKDWRDGQAYIKFNGQKKEDEKTIEEIIAEVRPLMEAEIKDDIINNAKIEYSKMDKSSVNALEFLGQKGNLDKISSEEIKKSFMQGEEVKTLDELYQNEDDKKAYAAKILNTTVDKLDELEDWEESANNIIKSTVNTSLAELNTIPEFLSNHLTKDLVNKIDTGSLSKVGDMYTKILAKSGEEGLQTLDNIVESAGDQADEVLSALANMDLSNMSVEQVNAALADLGITFTLTEGQVFSLKQSLSETFVQTAEAAQETYKSVSSVLSKLKKEGDIIEDKDYETLLQINPAISTFFTTLADGTHMLTGEVKDFQRAMQTATINQLYQVQQNAAQTAFAYGELQNGYSTTENIKRDNGAGDSSLFDIIHNASNNDLWDKYEKETLAKLQILKQNESTQADAEKYQARINAAKEEGKELYKSNQLLLDINKSFDSLNLKTEDFADKAQEAQQEIAKINEQIKESQYQFEISNAGLDYETTENYAKTLMDVHEAEGLSKEAARELAIANQRLDRGLTSLNNNFEAWSKSLKNTKRDSAEYAKTIGEIRESFADLLNVADTDELSLTWIEQWANNADELKKIMDGDTEAIQRFRESAFVEITTNVFDDVKESANEMFDTLERAGNEEIYDSLQKLVNQLNTGALSAEDLRNKITDIGNSEIGSGAVLSKEYTEALNTMLAQGLLTEQQLNDIFATIGYKPKVTTKNVNQTIDVPIYRTYEQWDTGDASPDAIAGISGMGDNDLGISTHGLHSKTTWTEQIGTKRMTQSVPAVQIESADSATGNIEIVNAGSANITPSYSSTTSGMDKGSNNSSSSTPTTKAASHSHEVNRYSDEENTIKGLSDQLKHLNEMKDKAFGASRVKAIENEIKKLKELKQASADYVTAIAGGGNAKEIAEAIYTGKNIGQMISSGQLGGTVASDYNALYGGLDASGKGLEYTAKDDVGNEWLVSDAFNLAKFNSAFGSNLTFNLDTFGNIQNKDDILNFLQRLSNEENSNYSQYADPDASSQTRHNERLALIKSLKERINYYGETVGDLSEQTNNYLDYITQLQEKNAELITTKMNTGVELGNKTTQKINRALKVLGDDIYKSAEAMSRLQNLKSEEIDASETRANSYMTAVNEGKEGWQTFMSEGGALNENAISPSQFAEILNEAENGLDTEIDNLLSTMEYFESYYNNFLQKWNETINKTLDKMEDSAKVFDHYQRVIELTGRSTNYDLMGKLLSQQVDNNQTLYRTRMLIEDDAKQEYEKAQQELEEMRKNNEQYSEKALEAKEKQIQSLYADWIEKRDKMFESQEKFLETVNSLYQNNINKAFSEYEKNITGDYGSFQALDDAMSRQKSLAEDYLTKTNQIYETNKLMRSLQQDIDKTDNQASKQRLKSFSDEIALMQKKGQLSKVELDIAKARYEVLKAQIALEEAQNAKSTVRLRRDSEGNYGYVYTADQNAIANAEQNLEDKQNALYNLSLQYTQEYSEKLIQMQREASEAIKAIAEDTTLTVEEKEKKIAEIQEYYNQKRKNLLEIHNIAIAQLDESAIEGRVEAYTDGFEQLIVNQDDYENHFAGLTDKIMNEIDEQDNRIKEFTEETKTGNDEIIESVNEVNDATKELSNSLKNQLENELKKTRQDANNLTNEFISQYNRLSNLIEQYSNFADEVNNLCQEIMSLTNAQLEYNSAVANSGTVDTSGSGGGASYSDNKSGNSGNDIPRDSGNTIDLSKQVSFYEYYNTDKHKVLFKDGHSEFQNHTYNHGICSKCGYSKTWKQIASSASGIVQIQNNGLSNLKIWVANTESMKEKYGFKTGGYTGSWRGADIEENGKLAFLHQKELVLNADDTENMLSAVKLIRQISQIIDLQATAQSASLQTTAAQLFTNDKTLQQEVNIHAEFPNVQDHNEIEQAFRNLVNQASQYANRF